MTCDPEVEALAARCADRIAVELAERCQVVLNDDARAVVLRDVIFEQLSAAVATADEVARVVADALARPPREAHHASPFARRACGAVSRPARGVRKRHLAAGGRHAQRDARPCERRVPAGAACGAQGSSWPRCSSAAPGAFGSAREREQQGHQQDHQHERGGCDHG